MKLGAMPGNSSHFAQQARVEIPRSQFNLSHGHMTTFDAGYLVPVLCMEGLPGDTFKVNMNGFARLSTPIKPLMENLYLDSFFFAVPYRLLWDNFEKFMGAQDTPGASTDYLIPQVGPWTTGGLYQTLLDYFGLPIFGTAAYTDLLANALPFRAYNLIYNEWFRDQNLQAKITVPTGDGPDAPGQYALMRRGKRADYFTSCLPWPQKGNAARIPLANAMTPNSSGSSFANVRSDGIPFTVKNVGGSVTAKNLQFGASAVSGAVNFGSGSGSPTSGQNMVWDQPGLIVYDGQMGTINQLRQAYAVQRLLEKEARGGTRYTEWVRAVFGVVSPDARLQRPEYLGGGSSPVVISPIAQTQRSDVAPATPQGNLAAMGTISWQRHGFAKSLTEHCIIIGLVSVRADQRYQNGKERMWSRRTKLDHFTPGLAFLGEQAVMQNEIFYDSDTNTQVFGYQERYAEYRHKPSIITGQFRSSHPQSLDIWHLADEYLVPPALNSVFIQVNPDVDRVVAVPSEPHFLADMFFEIQAARPIPTFGIPGMSDHF